MAYTLRAELARRIAALQAKLQAREIDCVLIRHNVNLFYFAGTIQNSHLFIPASGEPVLMVRRDFMRARIESALPKIVPLRRLRQLQPLLAEHRILPPKTLGLELDVLPAYLYLTYQDLFAGTRLVDAGEIIRQVRAVKSTWELALIERAAEQADVLFRTARAALQDGISEIELSTEVERAARLQGHQGLIRMHAWNSDIIFGFLTAGLNAAVPTHLDAAGGGTGVSTSLGQGASFRRIRRGEPVCMDMTGCVDGYLADQTRMLILGEPPARVRSAYEAMREVYARLLELLRPGVPAAELYTLAVNTANGLGYGTYFMGTGEARLGFVGHGIGLELDEPPPIARGISTIIEEGMVIALEPKVVVPGLGAIGIENSHLITSGGYRKLTFSDEELAVVE